MSEASGSAVPRGGALRGAGPRRGGDFLDGLGFKDVEARTEEVAQIMKPGALRGAARGRNLDSLAHTLFLRIYPVIAVAVLLTQIGIAWTNYRDGHHQYADRANLVAALTATAIARPGWDRNPEIYRPQIQALGLDPDLRYAVLRNAEGHVVASVGQPPREQAWQLIQVVTDLTLPGSGEPAGSLSVTVSAKALERHAQQQALLALGTSLILMLAFVVTLHHTVARHVIAPLKRLLVAMREVEHQRWATVDLGGNLRPSNEIDAISTAFNNMVEGLRTGTEAKRLLQQLEAAHAELGEANRQVMESIGYAKRIQSSVLPERTALAGSGVELAVLYEPLHLVGGDYFWLEDIDGKSIVLVADCTGHGVPGAFLTLIVATALDRLLHERGLRSPAELLAGLDAMVRTQLRQDGRGADSDDGLDCGICVVDRAAGVLHFAGAGLALTRIAGGAVTRWRGDRRGLGYPRDGREAAVHADLAIPLEPGATFYMMTDGITDQMGRPLPSAPARLLGHRGVTAILEDHQDAPLSAQVEAVETALAAYRGEEERRDDMTLIAFRPLA
ncbi:PP2C family protein-serine/threonine phosphatase [Methylobacterium organophilum]|uniref:HAMP domain-containing protein n=1 Tax=Methylobacterium organophilum TaxID=410 RepID=A0ABQ4TG18_METOR|nr:SpoIIE family protein phosphatase [Methylobacterium organophilum]GJE29689.1 hypothetical protein LKMONMHP_4573 [Methylobacterium organophilum]